MLLASALSGLLAQSPASATPIDVSAARVGAPTVIADLDMHLMKGDVRRLSWSPDGGHIHIQTIERETVRDYIVTLPEGEVSLAFGEPEWAARYWTMKSDLEAPGVAGMKIEVLEDHQRTRPTPFSGGFTAGGAQAVDPRNPVDTYSIEVKLELLGEEVGYF
jgi:hypothetical protein